MSENMSDQMKGKNWSFETKAINIGQEHTQWSNNEMVPPIVTSATYHLNDPSKITFIFHLSFPPYGLYYTRVKNPTRDALERCLAGLDNGKHGLVYPSGLAAVTALLQFLKTGDHIVSGSELFGGTYFLLTKHAKAHGIGLDFVDSTDIKQVKNAIKSNTKLVFIETPSNPCSKISDVSAIAKLAHSQKNHIVFAVDNTWLTPYFQRPLELGADVVMYSLSKYMNGHNDVVGGALIVNDDQLYEQFHLVQTSNGSFLSPFDCYLVNRGLKTLPLRMRKHCENGIAVARHLEKHPKVLKVFHPALVSHPQYELAKKQSSGHCGMLTFDLKGTPTDAANLIKNFRVIKSSASLGGFSTYATIPACVSHYDVPKEEREKLGILDSTIRLSVGLENIVDLIEDLDQAILETFF